MPTAQLVSIKLIKNATSAKPKPYKLKPKKISASTVTGMTPIRSRTMLMTMSAIMNSNGRSGLIIRLPMLRDHISSRNDMEKPSCPRNRMSQSNTAPISVPPARAKKLAFCIT